jgi:sterol desaturase/sphingolipid hydroxylase (fatty acid hydroxylase superfamily)
MTAMILSTEPLIRLGFFAGVFALMAAWEMLAPRRPQTVGRTWRWPNNLGVVVVDTLVVRFFSPTTGVRFHPIEVLISIVIKLGAVAALGASVLGVLAFEVLLNATSMFNHGNVRLPQHLDGALRWVVVTPEIHRVHHSIEQRETNSNFGFNLSWWDRLFGTYRAEPEAGHEGMTIGVPEFREKSELRLDRMLLQPLRGADL